MKHAGWPGILSYSCMGSRTINEFVAETIRAGLNLSSMLRYNALGNGKSEAVAGDIAAGSVSAVKAEKQVFDFFFRERRPLI